MMWTEGRRKAFITSVLRGGFRRYPAKYEALQEACVGVQLNPKTGRMAKHYYCTMCKIAYPAKDVQVDHKSPVVPLTGFTTWDSFINRLYCLLDNLQVLCKECHKLKSSGERKKRKKNPQ